MSASRESCLSGGTPAEAHRSPAGRAGRRGVAPSRLPTRGRRPEHTHVPRTGALWEFMTHVFTPPLHSRNYELRTLAIRFWPGINPGTALRADPDPRLQRLVQRCWPGLTTSSVPSPVTAAPRRCSGRTPSSASDASPNCPSRWYTSAGVSISQSWRGSLAKHDVLADLRSCMHRNYRSGLGSETL